MNWTKLEFDHVRPICVLNVSKVKKLSEAFNWKKTQTLLKQDHQHRGTKFTFIDYQLQFFKAYQFIKLREEGYNENFH